MKTKLLFLLIILAVSGCDPHDAKLTLVNSTNDTIYFKLSFDNDNFNYPIRMLNGKVNYDLSSYIPPNFSAGQPNMSRWEDFINENCTDSSISILFFSKEFIKNVGEDSIMKYKLSSQRFKLNVKDLERLNWRVAYMESEDSICFDKMK